MVHRLKCTALRAEACADIFATRADREFAGQFVDDRESGNDGVARR